jgi:hypothetical protein
MLVKKDLRDIPKRILQLALGALSQANTYAVYTDPGLEYRGFMSVLSTAHAGELFLKAVIAKEHPLLIFKDIFALDDQQSDGLDLKGLLQRGRTHDFEKLPQIVWAVTGSRVPNLRCYERLRKARNAVQHFVAPPDEDFRSLSLEFIYTILDPLIRRHFGIYAIEHHEDFSIGYDYVVAALLRSELKFSVPPDFSVSEIRLYDEIEDTSAEYRKWLTRELTKIGKEELLRLSATEPG